jgi:hypothetical protein
MVGDTLNRSIGVHFSPETIPILASTILFKKNDKQYRMGSLFIYYVNKIHV